MRTIKAVSVDTPTALLPPDSEEEYTPRYVKRWVSELPLGHRGETTKRLFRTLKQLNRLDIPVRDRFEVMLILQHPIDSTVQALQRHLLNQPFPLNERSILIAEVINELLAGMVISFRIVLNAGRAKNWLYQRVQQRMWIVSLFHMLRYFERILCNHRMINMERPKGLWKGVHRLYLQTLEADWHRAEIGLEDGALEETTIEREYKKTLLVSLLSRHQVRGDQFDELAPLLEYWADMVTLRPPGKGQEHQVTYCIPRNADTPPQAMGVNCHKECGGSRDGVVLDTANLKVALLKLLRSSGDYFDVHEHRIGRETLELLFDSWCMPHVREERRHPGGGVVEVALGLSTINRVISSRYAEDAVDQGAQDSVSLEHLQDALGPLLQRAEGDRCDLVSHVPVTNIVYDDPEFHRMAWKAEQEASVCTPGEAQVINYSAHGYCLSVCPPEHEYVRNGDVIGIYNGEKDTWSLGQLRWLKGEVDREVVMGVRMLSSSVLPIGVRVALEEGRHSERVPALLGLDERCDLLIVMPALPAVRQKRLVIDYRGHLAPIRLTRRIAATPAFVAYQLIEAGLYGTSGYPFATLPSAVNQLEKPVEPHEVAARVITPNNDRDDYADLWDKL